MRFFSKRGLKCLGVATGHDLYKKIGDFDMCIEFEIFKVKVPINFLGTVGFSLRREGRVLIMKFIYAEANFLDGAGDNRGVGGRWGGALTREKSSFRPSLDVFLCKKNLISALGPSEFSTLA